MAILSESGVSYHPQGNVSVAGKAEPQLERITRRMEDQKDRLATMVDTLESILVKLRGDKPESTKVAGPPIPVRGGILGHIEDVQDTIGRRQDTLNQLLRDLSEIA